MSIGAGTLREHSHKTVSKRRREVASATARDPRLLSPSAILQRAALAPGSLRPADILRLQQTVGNRAIGVLLNRPSGQRPIVQAKLMVNAPGDEYEQEADRVAEQVMRMPAVRGEKLEDEESEVMTRPLGSSIQSKVWDEDELEEEEPGVMTKPYLTRRGNGPFEVGEDFERPLRASRGQGEPLPAGLREEFEAKFGADFGGVRVHSDAESDELNRSMQAKAFTAGQDVFFRQGAYNPESQGGQELIAHELTHLVQQQPAETAYKTPDGGGKAPEAARLPKARQRVAAKRTASTRIASSGITLVQRKAEPEHQFSGREQETVGVGEKVILSVSSALANQHRGKLEWVVGSSAHNMGQLGQTDAHGKAEFTAGDGTDHVTLICRTKYIYQELERATFSIVEPNGGHMEQAPGTQIRHIADYWNVSFVGNQFLHPRKVSFHKIEFGEEQAPAQYQPSKNDWLAQTADHKQGPWVDVEAAKSTKGSQVSGDDWVSSGIHQGFPRQNSANRIQWNQRPPGQPAMMTWSIPWRWRLSGTTGPGKVFATLDHVAYDYGNGEARLTKGGVDVRANATDQPQWFYPNVDDNIVRIKGYYDPSRHGPGYGRQWQQVETRLRQLPPFALADLLFMVRENAWSPRDGLDASMTLDALITREAQVCNVQVP